MSELLLVVLQPLSRPRIWVRQDGAGPSGREPRVMLKGLKHYRVASKGCGGSWLLFEIFDAAVFENVVHMKHEAFFGYSLMAWEMTSFRHDLDERAGVQNRQRERDGVVGRGGAPPACQPGARRPNTAG
ncbi:hypothetical protein E2C01_046116 [Portunus trituberculatus]|uniref:Uncharacterized protein n=1 Tax=Portunus trituberculatus TaxID=210409 RepID=A0A5B7G4Q6_PORTR|nr:hypothetical protein [Portunus trituberculatus]